MQFQVPQFIETEDKIVGPLSIRQFLYIALGAILSFLLFFPLTFGFWLFFTLIINTFTVGFAFIKVNGRPLPTIAASAMGYFWRPRFYLWQKKSPQPTPAGAIQTPAVPKKSVVENLWQQLTTSRTPIPQREKALKPSILDRVKSSKERFEMVRRITGDREVARRVDYR